MLKRHKPECVKRALVRITFPSSKVLKSKRAEEVEEEIDEDDGEHETLEEALGIDADVRVEDNNKKPENILVFNQFKNTYMVPFVLYVDFETFIKKGVEKDVLDEDNHEPSGFACLRVSSFDFLNNEKAHVYSGPNVMHHFYEHVMKEHPSINDILSLQKPMAKLSDDEQKRYDAARVCGTCKQKFTDVNVKVHTVTICQGNSLGPHVKLQFKT